MKKVLIFLFLVSLTLAAICPDGKKYIRPSHTCVNTCPSNSSDDGGECKCTDTHPKWNSGNTDCEACSGQRYNIYLKTCVADCSGTGLQNKSGSGVNVCECANSSYFGKQDGTCVASCGAGNSASAARAPCVCSDTKKKFDSGACKTCNAVSSGKKWNPWTNDCEDGCPTNSTANAAFFCECDGGFDDYNWHTEECQAGGCPSDSTKDEYGACKCNPETKIFVPWTNSCSDACPTGTQKKSGMKEICEFSSGKTKFHLHKSEGVDDCPAEVPDVSGVCKCPTSGKNKYSPWTDACVESCPKNTETSDVNCAFSSGYTKFLAMTGEAVKLCPTDADDTNNICSCKGDKAKWSSMTNACLAACPGGSNDSVKAGECACPNGQSWKTDKCVKTDDNKKSDDSIIISFSLALILVVLALI